MNEVKQAWTSLLSSRTLLTTANSTCSGNNTNSISNSVNSTTTWYDAPVPVIVHGRTFREEIMDTPNGNIVKNAVLNFEDSGVKVVKRRVSKDSGIETIASLRRTFLDEFRKSNDVSDAKMEKTVEAKAEETEEIRKENSIADAVTVDENSLESSSPREYTSATNPQLGAINDEVLYQNNVEAALNSLSKVCAKDLDISGDSACSRNPEEVERLGDGEDEEDDKEREDMDDSVGVERRRRRRTSSSSRRHSSSVEITAVTSVKTGDDGVPTICFSFLRSEENSKPYIRDIPIDDDGDEISLDSSGQLVREQLYDFPKSGRAKRISEVNKEDGIDATDLKEAGKSKEPVVKLPERRVLGDGSVGSDLIARTPVDQLYDFPKRRVINGPPESIKVTRKDDLTDKIIVRDSACLNAEEGEESEERLYESPMHSKNALSSTWKESTGHSSPENERDTDQQLETDSGELPSPLGLSKRTFRSLRSGRSIGTLGNPAVDHAAAVKGYYSDPEAENVEGIERGNGDRRKSHKHHRRLGKAWGKMRSWLRDEKSRFGDVVTRHARMQAVGALKVGKSEDGSSLGSRTGSYDLIDARTRELGSITRVEEFGLSSVSEEGNASESERPDCTSYDLHPDTQSPMEIGENDDDDDDDDNDRKKNKLDSSNDSSDAALASGKLRKKSAISTDNMLSAGTRMKLTPVSFSPDKLCADEGNDEGTNATVAGHRDSEQTRDHVGKGGLIKRRMLGSIRGLMASTHLLQQHETEEGGPGGFEDVRRYVKQGGDFCKELAAILHERAELEASYSKGLSKLSCKLTKACTKDQGGNSSGGVTEAWRSIGEEMEAAAEAHRAWGVALSEQLAKPLRVGVAEAQGRSRKVIESSVDKASKSLQEWRGIAAKSKKQSFACARENERLQDLARIQSISQSQQNNNKTSSHHMTEKEVNKLETRRRKAEDSSRRADTEFYTVSVRSERARLEYESTVRKGAKQMELLEEERLSALKDLANVYLAHLQALAPRLQQSADRLSSPVRNCNVSQDVDILKNVIRRLDSHDASNVDQLLPDFYAEHVTLAMNRERRKQSLVRVLHLIRQDLERERRGREGLETLHRAFIQTPAFAADESTQNVTEKLHHMRSMLTFLEAARYKVGGTLAEVEGGKRGKHPLAEHILVSRDKQGLQQSVLKVPSWAKNESFEFPEVQDELDIHLTKEHESERRDWVDRTAGDGNSENPPDEEDFSDFDEFSSQSEDNNNQEVEIADITDKGDRIEQCRAIYQYSANLNDELSLTPGDLINIHEKQADGWWIGECGGRTGIFPATYVQVIH